MQGTITAGLGVIAPGAIAVTPIATHVAERQTPAVNAFTTATTGLAEITGQARPGIGRSPVAFERAGDMRLLALRARSLPELPRTGDMRLPTTATASIGSFFSRLWNVTFGKLLAWITGVEVRNPEAVYEAAINERINTHATLKKAVAGIVHLRNKLTGELEAFEKSLAEIRPQIEVAVESGDDEVALVLIQTKDELTTKIASHKEELGKISTQAEESKNGLIAFQGEIEKLKREKDEMLAKMANAEARIKIQETLDGLSTDADIKALDNVRENIGKLQAEADVGAEIKGDSLDARLKTIKAKTANVTAAKQLDELKRQMAAKNAAAQAQAASGAPGRKTI